MVGNIVANEFNVKNWMVSKNCPDTKMDDKDGDVCEIVVGNILNKSNINIAILAKYFILAF